MNTTSKHCAKTDQNHVRIQYTQVAMQVLKLIKHFKTAQFGMLITVPLFAFFALIFLAGGEKSAIL